MKAFGILLRLLAAAWLLGCDSYVDFRRTMAGAGGAGGGEPCVPGTTVPCYDGPGGTEGVGLCRAGTRTCQADGTGYDACLGAVLPARENCATPVDEDCDGSAEPCYGVLQWGRRFGDEGPQYPTDVAIDSAGSVFIVGYADGTIDFGGGPLGSTGGAGNGDAFLTKLGADGEHIWSKLLGGASYQAAEGVAVDGAGNVLFAGHCDGDIDLGGGPLAGNSIDVFLAKLDGNGAHIWSARFGSPGIARAFDVAMDKSGAVVITGEFTGELDFGAGPLSSAGGRDLFIAKFDASGTNVWARRFGDGADQIGSSIVASADGGFLVAGGFSGTIDFGTGALWSEGGRDIFMAKLDADGIALWAKSFGDASEQVGAGITADQSGRIVLIGSLEGSMGVDFGGRPLVGAGARDAFLASFEPDGTHRWSRLFGDAADQFGHDAASDASGNVVFTGQLLGEADFGGGPLAGAGAGDAFLAKLGPDGVHLWSKRFGDDKAQAGEAVAADAAGNVVLVGKFVGNFDLGGVQLSSAGDNYDIFVAKFSP